MAQWDVIRPEAMNLSVHARIDSSGYNPFLWESDHDRNGHAATFDVKSGKKTERAATESRKRSAEQLFHDLELVALAVEGSDLGTIEDPFRAYSKMQQ